MAKRRTKTFTLDTEMLDKIADVIGKEKPKTYIIHDGVEYGIYVELGTTRQRAQPALVPAWEKHTRALSQVLGEAIEQAAPLNTVLRLVANNVMGDWKRDAAVDTGAYQNSIIVSEE